MKLLIIFLFISTLSLTVSQPKWQKLNGPEGGVISALLTKGDTLLAGTGYYKALIFYSTNKGINWQKADFKKALGNSQSRVNDFVSCDDEGFIAAVGKDGIYKSFDIINWTKVFNNGQDFWSLGKDNNGVLSAGSDGGKIYSSINNGNNWSLFFDNYNDRIVRFLKLPSGKMIAGAINNIFKKDINHVNWSSLNLDSVQGYIRPFVDDSNKIFFFSGPWLFSSSDLGETWKKSGVIPFLQGNYMLDCLYNKRMIAAMDDETGFYGTGWGIALSDDKGLTWRWSNDGLPPKFNACFKLAVSGNDTYVGTNAAGIYKSSNFGDSWFPVNNGITAANTLDITFDDEGILYTVSWSNGIHKSTNKGLTWETINNGLTNTYLYSIVRDKDILLAGTDQGTFRTTNKGEDWDKINSWFFVFLYKDSLNRLYGLRYGAGLYRSSDAGSSWTRLDNGFISGYIYGFALDKKDNIYAGTFGGAIYRSTDDGTTWAKIYQSNVSNSFIMSLAEAPNGYLYAINRYEGILRSTDNGESWSVKKTDTNYQFRMPIAVNKEGTVFASGSNSKFYSSTDNGESWKDITDNLLYTSVQKIDFDKEGKMYLATDESVWTEAPDSIVNISESKTLQNRYSLEQNYPNPFNPTTTIKYSLQKESNVLIKIFNSLGQEVRTLLNEPKSPGAFEINFDGSSLPSGVYFYRIQAGDFIQGKKMILLR